MGWITGKKNVAERSRLMAELDNERRSLCVGVLLSGVPEIKEKISEVN